jgi:preprotein translocase subunit SecG
MGILTGALLIVFGISAVLLVIIILMQDEQSEGLGGIFGGGASNQVGNRKGNILTKTTTFLGIIFIVVAFAVAWLNHNTNDASGIEKAALSKQGSTAGVEWWNTTGTAPAASDTAPAASASPAASSAASPDVKQ